MEQKFKQQDQDENESIDAGFTLPDTKSILERLEAAEKFELRREHKVEMEKEEKTGKAKKRQRQGGSICMCEDPQCRIGPFIEKR